MDLSLITLLIVAVICLLLGGIAGFLMSSGSSESDEDPEYATDQAPPGGRKGRYEPLVRLWREKKKGALIVEVGNKSYLSPEPISSDQIERLKQIASDFYTWLGLSASSHQSLTPTMMPKSSLEDVSEISRTNEGHEVLKQSDFSVQSQPIVNPIRTEQNLPSATRPQYLPVIDNGTMINNQGTQDAPKSMVEQIDAILKRKIIGTVYESQGLSLSEDPTRGVVVWIGSSSYVGIDGVPDESIRNIIRSAVADWERREDELSRKRIG